MVTLDFAATILLAADRRSGLRCIYPFSTAALSHPPVFTGTCAIVAPIRGCRPSSGNGAGPDMPLLFLSKPAELQRSAAGFKSGSVRTAGMRRKTCRRSPTGWRPIGGTLQT
jgi:hypothetical protein